MHEGAVSIAFTITLTDRDWDSDTGAWRCPALRIPGAVVDAIFVAGSRANRSSYEVLSNLALIRWLAGQTPREAAVALTLAEELSTEALTLKWRKLAIILPFAASVVVCVITAVTSVYIVRLKNTESSPVDVVKSPQPEKSDDYDREVPRTATAEHAAVPPAVVKVHRDLQTGISTPRFVARPHVRQGVVEGKPGRYYLVRLKDAAAQELVFFEGGKYEKDELGRELNDAIDAFRHEVTDALSAEGIHFEMFVRGSADNVANEKEYLDFLKPWQSKVIEYHPALDQLHNVFAGAVKARVVTGSYANQDLPDLRAAFIRDRLKDNGLRARILEGIVTKKENKADRNVMMLLFVTWPSELDRSE